MFKAVGLNSLLALLVGSSVISDRSSPASLIEMSSEATTTSGSSIQFPGFKNLEDIFETIFKTYPAARNITDPVRLGYAATLIFGAEVGRKVETIVEKEKDNFKYAREKALAKAPIRKNGKQVVISGLSTSGMAAAMVASNAGYKVIGYEQRLDYTRNIQWTARQSLIDMFAMIDQGMANRFFDKMVQHIATMSDQVDGKVKQVTSLPPPEIGDPTRAPHDPAVMLDGDTVMALETKSTERFLREELRRFSNVTVVNGKWQIEQSNGKYTVSNVGQPELMIVAEGSGSATRSQIIAENPERVRHAPTSPERTQIAGELVMERNGALNFNSEKVKDADGKIDVLLTSGISNAGSGRTWGVTDVSKSANLEPDPKKFVAGSPEFLAEKQRLVNDYYYSAVGKNLQMPPELIRQYALGGPKEASAATPFKLQQGMTNTAVYADNMVALGDTVGHAHWSVGGGVATALGGHIRRLGHLLFDLQVGRDRAASLKEYDRQTLKDTLEWERRGIVDFYPEYDPKSVQEIFDGAIDEWLSSKDAKSPKELIAGRISKSPKSAALTATKKLAPLTSKGGKCEALF